MAVERRLTVKFVKPATGKIPLLPETVSQRQVLASDQFSEEAPVFVSNKVVDRKSVV